ncbi:class I SAM-dependent methyltransferase, partial [Candidatus Woesearchaeota archaeon]|nr:class I SAM-dependent methyltransferase [Candidatus Woesearchaeota archaeon]
VEYSPNMLNNAKNKKELKKCRFICSDIRKLDLKEKFDLIISIFSFGLHAYFDREEMLILWKKIRKHLKSDGIIALTGHEYPVPRTLFKELKSGKLKIIKNYSANWFIGSKKEIKK